MQVDSKQLQQQQQQQEKGFSVGLGLGAPNPFAALLDVDELGKRKKRS